MRDWQKDWQLCQDATPGPWVVKAKWIGTYNGILTPELVDSRNKHIIEGRAHSEQWYECTAYIVGRFLDLQLAAEARTALPYWLTKCKDLETALARAIELLARSDSCPRDDTCYGYACKEHWHKYLTRKEDDTK